MRWPLLMAEAGSEGDSGAGSAPGSDGTPAASDGAGSPSFLAGEDMSLLDWRQSFPEDVRMAPVLQRFDTSEKAARALIEQDIMLGRALFLPDKRREPKDSDGYRASMQKVQAKLREYDPDLAPPEQADGYTLPVPEDREMTADATAFWGNVFHQAGITQGQAEQVMQGFWTAAAQAENQQAGRAQESYQEGRNALFREFGANTETELRLFEGFVNHFGAGAFSGEAGQKFLEQLQEATLADGSRLANSPYMVATFANAMRRMGEDEFRESEYYQPGTNTLETMETEFRALAGKVAEGKATPDEDAKFRSLSERIMRTRERAPSGARRVA